MIDVGTIGSLKCEVHLNSILMEISDPHVTKFVVGQLVKFRLGIRQLAYIPDKSFRLMMLSRWRDEFFKKVKDRCLPELVESHMCCTIMAHYRNSKAGWLDETPRPDISD